jgi:hypothetical protein
MVTHNSYHENQEKQSLTVDVTAAKKQRKQKQAQKKGEGLLSGASSPSFAENKM